MKNILLLVEKPQLTTSALKRVIEVTEDMVCHSSKVNCFMDRCLKFNHDLEGIMAPYREEYTDMQKKVVGETENLLKKDFDIQSLSSQMFTCLLIISLQVVFHVFSTPRYLYKV